MKGFFIWILTACCCGCGIFCAAASHSPAYAAEQKAAGQVQVSPSNEGRAATVAATSSSDAFEMIVNPMIKASCAVCPNAVMLTAGLDLQRFLTMSGADALKEREILTKVVNKLRAGEMPPEGYPKPSAAQVAAAADRIEQYYKDLDSRVKSDPGRVTAHRLNRFEYNNTVRDLLDVNLRLADDFPTDPYGYGFDNVSDVLTVSLVLTERYLKAAERAAKAAIPTGSPAKVLAVRYEAQALGQQFYMHIQTVHDFPAEALYNLRVGWEQSESTCFHTVGHIFLDGKEILNQPNFSAITQDRAFYARNVPIMQGPHLIEAIIEVPVGFNGGMPHPTAMEVMGPYKQVPREQTASYKRIVFKDPPTKSNRVEYNREILARLAHRAIAARSRERISIVWCA